MVITPIFFLAFAYLWTEASATCPERTFLGCVLRLKAQRVPFERNILGVVFKIDSEAKLKRTCRTVEQQTVIQVLNSNAYSNIMPCFRDKVNDCGDDKQKRLLKEVVKMIMFLCSPFSLDRQQRLLRYNKCIGDILKQPVTTGCDLRNHYYGKQFYNCRKICSTRPTDFLCMMKTWISEQNVCTVRDIEMKCGNDEAKFYVDMQSTVFEPLFPIICEYEEKVIVASTVRSVVTDAVILTGANINHITQVPRLENWNKKTKSKSPIPTVWIPNGLKNNKENNSSFITSVLHTTIKPKFHPPPASRPVTVLSLFHKLFPISSKIPDKIKSIIDTKFPVFATDKQIATTTTPGYTDRQSNVEQTTWTTPIVDIEWEVTPLVAPPTMGPITSLTPDSTYFNKNITTSRKLMTVIATTTTTTTTTLVPQLTKTTNFVPQTPSALVQLAPTRRWRPWYLSRIMTQSSPFSVS